MKKIIFIFSLLLLTAVTLSACSKKASEESTANELGANCSQICASASNACPSVINKTACENKCPSLSDEDKKTLAKISSCEDLAGEESLIVKLMMPQIPKPELNEPTNDCEAACSYYVVACLSLVPNATQELFDDGYTSCLNECSGWNAQKVDCMISAFDCEAMTDVCGL